MSETHTKQKIDLDALEAALAKSTPGEWHAERNSRFTDLRAGNHGIGDFCGSLFVTGGDDDRQLSFDNANAAALAHNALPALLAELRQLRTEADELRARTTPEVIGERHKKGDWWMVWEPNEGRWLDAFYVNGRWLRRYGPSPVVPTHALPMPEEVKP